ncbi:MAG TPA: ABC transporter permease [Mycobacteriales bacterium]
MVGDGGGPIPGSTLDPDGLRNLGRAVPLLLDQTEPDELAAADAGGSGRGWSRRWHLAASSFRAHPVGLAAAVVIAAFVAVVVFAGSFAPYDPLAQSVQDRLSPPSGAHPFGTDQLGRDVLSRVIFGGRVSVPAAILVVLISMAVGSLVGLVSGFVGSWIDDVLMRVTDVFFAFPVVILAMAIAASLGPSLRNGIIALAVVMWPLYARVVRSVTLDLRSREFVLAAKIAGKPTRSILLRTILPNAMPTALVIGAVDIGRAIVNLAVLSFIGLGARPPTPEWGSMVADGAQVTASWWVSTFPGVAILVLVLGFNLIGDALRDFLDPFSKSRVAA